MSTPVVWIFVPFLIGLGLLAIQRYTRLSLLAGGICTSALALSARLLPIGRTFFVGPLAVRLADTLEIAGRRFVLGEAARPILILLFLGAAFWYFGALAARVNSFFAPVGFAMLAFFVAALSVQPFLYSALLIEMAVLSSIPLLAQPRQPVRSGVTRYLIFQTTALPFILFTGWMLTGVEAGNADINLPLRAGILLGIGFALLLAVFPFHAWIPLIAEQSHPYAAAFVFVLLQTSVLLFGMELLNQFTWLRTAPAISEILRLTGAMMVVAGGVLAAFQNHLGRVLGFAVVYETGFSLIAASLGGIPGVELFSMLFLPRIAAFALWALALSVALRACGSLSLGQLSGVGRRYPLVFGAIILANLSLVSIPLLAGFPVKLALLETLAVQFPVVAIWTLLGMLGLMAAGLRALGVFTAGEPAKNEAAIPLSTQGLLLLGVFSLFLIGILPQIFLTPMLALLKSLPNLL